MTSRATKLYSGGFVWYSTQWLCAVRRLRVLIIKHVRSRQSDPRVCVATPADTEHVQATNIVKVLIRSKVLWERLSHPPVSLLLRPFFRLLSFRPSICPLCYFSSFRFTLPSMQSSSLKQAMDSAAVVTYPTGFGDRLTAPAEIEFSLFYG